LAALARAAIEQMQAALKDRSAPPDAAERAQDWIAWIAFYLPDLDRRGDQPLAEEMAARARAHLQEGTHILEELQSAKQVQIKEELLRSQSAARAVAASAEQLQPALQDGLRAAYRTGDEHLIETAADTAGKVLDIGIGIHELSRQMSEALAETMHLELGEVSRFTEALGTVNKALAAINLALTLTAEKQVTELEEGMRQISAAGEMFGSLVTLTGLAAHMGLYANLYLIPACKAIMANIHRLVDLLHAENKEWVELTGELQYPGAEPGGDEMFRFMTAVMRSERDEVPPMSSSVREYLLDHREALEAGASEEVPTTGWWFWRKLDTEEARRWIYMHRQRVWAMFYGSMQVPAQKAR
jgi:hypothetical protein